MNANQKKLLIVVLTAVVVTLVFPPFHLRLPNGFVRNFGYGLLFDPPTSGSLVGNVDIGLLITEWLGILMIGGIAFFLLGGIKAIPQDTATAPQSKPDSSKHQKWLKVAGALLSQQRGATTPEMSNQAVKSEVMTTEDKYYEQALEEMVTGQTAKAMWARAIADSEGNDAKAKALYIRYRVEKLKALAAEEQARVEADKRDEQARRKAEQRDEEAQRREEKKTEEGHPELLQSLARKIQSPGLLADIFGSLHDDAVDLIKKLGGTYQPLESISFFGDKIVVNLWGERHEFSHPNEFVHWVQKYIVPRIIEMKALRLR